MKGSVPTNVFKTLPFWENCSSTNGLDTFDSYKQICEAVLVIRIRNNTLLYRLLRSLSRLLQNGRLTISYIARLVESHLFQCIMIQSRGKKYGGSQGDFRGC